MNNPRHIHKYQTFYTKEEQQLSIRDSYLRCFVRVLQRFRRDFNPSCLPINYDVYSHNFRYFRIKLIDCKNTVPRLANSINAAIILLENGRSVETTATIEAIRWAFLGIIKQLKQERIKCLRKIRKIETLYKDRPEMAEITLLRHAWRIQQTTVRKEPSDAENQPLAEKEEG